MKKKGRIDLAIHCALKRELENTKQRYEAAKLHFRDVTAHSGELIRYTAGMPESDGHQILRNALHEENESRSAHIEALMRLNDYLLNGTIPEHLQEKKKSGQGTNG